jgi:hypothetical protein
MQEQDRPMLNIKLWTPYYFNNNNYVYYISFIFCTGINTRVD